MKGPLCIPCDPGDLHGTNHETCFLCSPIPDLLVNKRKFTNLIAGLGPVVDNYCLVASTAHIPSLADFVAAHPLAIGEILSLRSALQQRLGPILVTEHGRVPVCREDNDRHEKHCFHAHALFFPTLVSIEQPALSYYMRREVFSTLVDALNHALSADSYLLISQSPDRYVVLSRPLNAPRQLARTLVAAALGVTENADWRARPLPDESACNAQRLRSVLGNAPWSA
jgi:hypothetical protein